MSAAAVFFVGYSLEELACTPDYDGPFRFGDVLVVVGLGNFEEDLLVRRFGSKLVDMVWPEEVTP